MLMLIFRHSVFQQGLTYVFFDTLNRGLPLLLLPVLLRFMDSAEYGVIANYTILTSVLSVLVGLSVHGAVNVNYFKLKENEFREFISAAFLILAASTLAVFVVLGLFGAWIANSLGLKNEWVYLAVIVAAAEFVTLVNLVLWQAEQKARQFGFYQFCKMCTDLGFTLLLVVVVGLGATGRILAMSMVSIAFALLSLVVMQARGYLSGVIRRKHVVTVLAFGIPLIPHAMSTWLITGLDRVWLTHLVGLSAVGIYTVGYQIATVIGLGTVAFNKAYNPYVYRKLRDITYDEKVKLVKFAYIYFIVLLLTALIYGFGASVLVVPLIGEAYEPAARLVPLISLAFAIQGMYLMVVKYVFFVGTTARLAAITFSAALFHAGLSYVLIGLLGMNGAATAFLISSAITFGLTWALSCRVYDMPWFPWRRT